MCASMVSAPTLSARMIREPVPFTVPPISLSPGCLAAGIDSPVTMDSSTAPAPSPMPAAEPKNSPRLLAPGEQQLVGNPMPTYPQLVCGRPSTAATRVNNFRPTDMASVSKVIHTDNQLHAGQFGKTAYTEWI